MVASRSLRLASIRGSLLLCSAALVAASLGAGCSAGDALGTGGDGNGDGTGSGANGGVNGLGPQTGAGGGGDGVGPNGKQYCDAVNVDFVPRTPTVYILVDRSSSMFEANPTNTPYWPTLKGAVLPAVEQLQGDVRFGFGTYTGSPNSCTGLTPGAPIAENNYAAIQAAYDALQAPSEKGETPTPAAIAQAREILLADASPGDRFILLVSDGNPDFCDDGGPECGSDAVIYELQQSAAQGIRSFVFGITNNYVTNDYFHYFAQAGFGEQPNWTVGLDVGQYSGNIDSACTPRPGWAALKTASGKGEFEPLGTYSAAGSTRQAFLEADPAALATGIASTIDGLKSCTFDLGTSGVEVTAGGEESGDIFVDDVLMPLDQWHMNSPTVLELTGDACARWQQPEVTKFFAGFSCTQIIIR